MQLISSATVSGTVSSVTFSSIPQTFTDLIVLASVRHTNPFVGYIVAYLNGTVNGYTHRGLEGNGSSASSFSEATAGYNGIGMYFGDIGGTDYTSNTFSNCFLQIANYTGTAAKLGTAEGLFENNATTANMMLVASRSSVTAAVTSLVIGPAAASFSNNSTIYLYGLLKGSGGATVS